MFDFFSKIPSRERRKIIASLFILAVMVVSALIIFIEQCTPVNKAEVVPAAELEKREKERSRPEKVQPETPKQDEQINPSKPLPRKAPIAPKTALPRAIAPSEGFMKGFSYAGYGREVFSSKESDTSIARLAKTGTNWISIVPIWYQDNWRSTTIAPASYSPSDASLVRLFALARKHKMKIVLKPFVDSADDTWRAQFEPTNRALWFANYRKFILHYAKIAEKNKVPVLCIGTELTSSERYAKNWRTIIKDIRKVYKGKLTYAADYHDIHGKFGNWLGGGYLKVPFWKDLDYIGVDAYFPLTDKNNPTVAELVRGWQPWIREMAGISKKYGKQIVITEIEYLSADGTNSDPGAYRYSRKLDLKEQADCYEATLRVLPRQKWLKGMLWWRWDNPSTSDWGGGPRNDNCTPKGKPAEKILTKWFHRIK